MDDDEYDNERWRTVQVLIRMFLSRTSPHLSRWVCGMGWIEMKDYNTHPRSFQTKDMGHQNIYITI